ncbi:MAG: hypothetical protein BEN19_03255 [Epulopiscium sp. Nuni2H_MBin003]|nr:MAG: hypothetical protein BEN19_03255 [Epulopiscium sp. Nuni2H_MBin003]
MSSSYSILVDDCHSKITNHFTDIKLLDATIITLPDKVSKDYKGCGGRNSKASMKIQTLYSMGTHSIKHFDITQGVTHDTNALPEVINQLGENELLLSDLGYFDINSLRKIGEQNFFISRIKSNLLIFEEADDVENFYKEIDMTKLLKKNKTDILDKEIYIGCKDNNALRVRLIATKLPCDIASKRIQKAIKQNGGKEISAKKRTLLHYNIVITNVKSDKLEARTISELYRVRWQIELLFKVLKSNLAIDKMNNANTEYTEAFIYGRILGLLLTLPVYHELDVLYTKAEGRGVSIQRFYKLLVQEINSFIALTKMTYKELKNLNNTLLQIGKLALYEKRKRKVTAVNVEELLNTG